VGKHGRLTDRKATWPLLIEKAYAQQKGGIDEFDKGGNAGNAVEDLVDMDARRFDPRERNASWIVGKLAKAQKDKKPTTLGTLAIQDASKEKQQMMRTIRACTTTTSMR